MTMCGIDARSADLGKHRSEEAPDRNNRMHRIYMKIRLSNVKCTTDRNRVILTDPEGMIRSLKSVQSMTGVLESCPTLDRPRRAIPVPPARRGPCAHECLATASHRSRLETGELNPTTPERAGQPSMVAKQRM